MSDSAPTPTPTLFKQWRNQGDAAAGQQMAQRFSDWYYAITTCRLGDAHGRGPLQRACVRFQQGILSVTTAAELTDWSHGILMEEVRMAGGRIAGGDFPSALTRDRSPTELLRQVSPQIAPENLALLAQAYDAEVPIEAVTEKAEALGGYPFAVLAARLEVKRALLGSAAVAFTEVPEAPNLDLGPLPLYEAGRMQNEAEEAGFEKWMLSDMRLCKDIAEFGVFAQALRAGALRPRAEPAPPPAAAPPSRVQPLPPPEAPDEPPAASRGAMVPLVLAGAVGVVGIVLILGALAWMFLLR